MRTDPRVSHGVSLIYAAAIVLSFLAAVGVLILLWVGLLRGSSVKRRGSLE